MRDESSFTRRRPSRVRRRFWWVVLFIAALAGLLVAGWAVAAEFQSPAQREASVAPPERLPIVEPVVSGRLADEVQVRAVIGAAKEMEVVPTVLPAAAVVTGRLMTGGDEVNSGDSLLEVNGRPLFVFDGEFAFYRDMSTGMSGPDVTQLQDGLADAGFPAGEWEAGTFGSSTAWSIRQLYHQHGYDVLRDGPQCEAQGTKASDEDAEPVCEEPGWQVPLSEVAIVSGLPATLGSVQKVGNRLDDGDAIATVVSGGLVARADVLPQTAARLAQGMRVELITDEGIAVDATVTSIDATESDDGQNQLQVVVASDEKLDSGWEGLDVLARIVVDVVSEDALIVPSVAVSATPQGMEFVLVRSEAGSATRVGVRVLGELAGQMAVEPLVKGELAEGTLVVVG